MIENKLELVFNEYQSELNLVFKNYKNSSKIIYLLRYWILTNYIIYKIYGDDAYKKFLDSEFTNPLRFSFYYEQNKYDNPPFLKKNSLLIFNILKPYFKLRKLIYLGGGFPSVSLFEILHNRLSNIFIQNLPIIPNNEIRLKVNKIILNIFIDIGISNYSHEITNKLPNMFYSNPIRIIDSNDRINIKGSSSSFCEFNTQCRILLINSQLHITSYQHGGGYGCVAFENDFLFGKYESLLSDNFIDWGSPSKLSDQTIYKSFKINSNNEKGLKNLYWVESGTSPKLYREVEKLAHDMASKKSVKKFISNEIKDSAITFFSIPHPKTSDFLYKNYRNKDQIIRKRAETVIDQNDIVIFDHPFASLIYFCASNDIKYFVVSSREFMPRFSVQQTTFVNDLIKKGIFFFDDEQSKLSDALNEYF